MQEDEASSCIENPNQEKAADGLSHQETTMNLEPNHNAIHTHMQRCAQVFGGSAYCGGARNFKSGWGYGVVAYDDGDTAYVEITVSPGEGEQPESPISVAADLLSIPNSIIQGLGQLDGHWGSPHVNIEGALTYVACVPTSVRAGRALRKLIQRRAAAAS